MDNPKIQLFLLPFAGGNSASFHRLTEHLDPCIETICVEYAGRLSRRKEAYITKYKEFLKDTAAFINVRRKKLPFALLGYSLGSVLVYDLIVNQMLYGEADHCFICSRGDLKDENISQEYRDLSDKEFVQKMKELGGFDEKILENRRFLKIYMEPVRMDYLVWSDYRYIEQGRKIPCNTTVIYSSQDPLSAGAHEWKSLVSAETDFYELGENHFFINQYYKEMAELIHQHLIYR
ncbi:MAG: thioesterase [Lachnospiraceae bacterium]|nr:thioesterase [Lachnospiraceae bacterium]